MRTSAATGLSWLVAFHPLTALLIFALTFALASELGISAETRIFGSDHAESPLVIGSLRLVLFRRSH